MPPPALVTVRDAVASLKKFPQILENRKLPRYTDPIWKAISKDLGRKWSFHNVYTSVRSDRRRILSLAREEAGIVLPPEEEVPIPARPRMYWNEQNSARNGRDCAQSFSVLLGANLWAEIKTEDPAAYEFQRIGQRRTGLKRIIVDCDAGIDDAIALIILIQAHKQGNVIVKGITCVTGNTHVDNVVKNVFRTLETCNSPEIPVYRGACSALLDTESSRKAQNLLFHGNDGLGDVFTDTPDITELRSEHAVNALHRIVSESPDEISIVCLGPLTNIALTMKMFPDFGKKVKEFFVMGGNSTGKGNITAQAEFNFFADPESVHIVLNAIEKPFYLVPWETCLHSIIPQDWRMGHFGNIDNPMVKFINTLEDSVAVNIQQPEYVMCDPVVAAILLQPEMIEIQEEFHADIELSFGRTRGQVVLDHLHSRKPNVRLITKYDPQIFNQVMISTVS